MILSTHAGFVKLIHQYRYIYRPYTLPYNFTDSTATPLPSNIGAVFVRFDPLPHPLPYRHCFPSSATGYISKRLATSVQMKRLRFQIRHVTRETVIEIVQFISTDICLIHF